jgi:outer membrane protein TolC
MSLAQENVKAVEEHLKLSKKLFELGIVPEVDAVTAEVGLAKATMLLNQSKNEYEKSLGNLKLAMGIDINQTIDIEENNDYIPVKIDENNAMNKALENRAENKMLNSSRNLQNNINGTETAFAPTISAHTGYIVRNDDSMGRKNFYVELGISFPIFNIPGYKAKEERIKAVMEQIEKQKELLTQKIKLDVKNSLIDLKSAGENVSVSIQEIEVASRGLKISDGKYKAGVGTIMELMEAQLNLMKAKTDYLDSLYNYKIAIATVEHMVGVNIKDIEKSKE